MCNKFLLMTNNDIHLFTNLPPSMITVSEACKIQKLLQDDVSSLSDRILGSNGLLRK